MAKATVEACAKACLDVINKYGGEVGLGIRCYDAIMALRKQALASQDDYVRVPRDRLQAIADDMAEWVLPHEVSTINAIVTEFRSWLAAAPGEGKK